MITTKLKEMKKANLTKVSQHCDPEIQIWKQVGGNNASYSEVITDYYKFAIHLLVELGDARAKLARLDKK
ncbi:hypothetical protein [Acinetobacter haemolyticus]|uniref:hypothetical protein n=1 Tax=Acinetobacter haemolyticus TaxID=29430 RepID=UPI0021CD9EFD|nr:hypothetical protein [Acinetobacter haemolyticus]MCU4378238.1 hypothetical protein [Acinetobacter haemolyticus]